MSLVLLFDIENIKFRNRYGNPSVSILYRNLDLFREQNIVINGFNDRCLKRLKAVDVFLTQYRDQHIIHQNVDASVGTWFLSDTNGDIRFIGNLPSVTPKELVFVVRNFVTESIGFIMDLKTAVIS